MPWAASCSGALPTWYTIEVAALLVRSLWLKPFWLKLSRLKVPVVENHKAVSKRQNQVRLRVGWSLSDQVSVSPFRFVDFFVFVSLYL